MHVKEIELKNFRNYGLQKAAFSNGVNIVYGRNAQGKTNLLEAVFMLSGSRSWRAFKKSEQILFGEPFGAIKAQVFSRDRDFLIELSLFSEKRGAAYVNKVKAKSAGSLSDVFKCVIFSPEDLLLIKGPASVRRGFLDTALCQLSPRYAEVLLMYGRVLEQKSKLLKSGDRRETLLGILPEYNERLVKYGAYIIKKRAAFAEALKRECAPIHSLATGGAEELDIEYKTVSTVSNPAAPAAEIEYALREHLEGHAAAELLSESCLSGVHKDNLEIEINKTPAKTYASQGQVRTAVIALKLGEREIFKKDGGEYPVLLLDDVLSELDEPRQEFISSRIMGGQTILTCCEKPETISGARLLSVDSGTIKE